MSDNDIGSGSWAPFRKAENVSRMHNICKMTSTYHQLGVAQVHVRLSPMMLQALC